MTIRELLKRPKAFLPMVMSTAAVLTIVIHIARHGAAPQADEGAAAHLWQLLLLAQLPLVALFAIEWVPNAPRQALIVLALQAAGIAAAVTPVLLLGW